MTDLEEVNMPQFKRRVVWLSEDPNATVELYGSWNRFEKPSVLKYEGDGVFACEVEIPKGEHHYRFRIDEDWETDDVRSKTIKLGNEYNTLVVEDSSVEQAKASDDVDGTESILYDSVTRSFKVGRCSNVSKSKRLQRHGIEISLPEVRNSTADNAQENVGGIEGEVVSGRESRTKKRKRKRREKEPGTKSSVGMNELLADAFKKKEEEWATMCYVQQLRQQQSHDEEINRVRKLWREERQVRVDMHKKITNEKEELQNHLRKSQSCLMKLKNTSKIDQVAGEKKIGALNDELEKQKKEIELIKDGRKKLEADLILLKKEKSSDDAKSSETIAELRKQLKETKLALSTKNFEVETLSIKLSSSGKNIADMRQKHKQSIEAVRESSSIIKRRNGEIQVVIAKLKIERKQLEVELRSSKNEAQKSANNVRRLEGEVDVLKISEESLRRQIKQLESDTYAAEESEKKLNQTKEEYNKKIKHLNERCQILQQKREAANARALDMRRDLEGQLQKMRTEAENTINALSQEGTEAEQQLKVINANADKTRVALSKKCEEVRTLAARLKESEAEVTRKSKALVEAEEALIENKNQHETTSKKLSATKKKLTVSVEECKSLTESLNNSKKKIQACEKELSELKTSGNIQHETIESLRLEQESTQERVLRLSDDLQESRNEVNDLSEELSTVKNELAEKKINELALENKLKNLREAFNTLQKDSQSEVDLLNQKVTDLNKKSAATEEKVWEKLYKVQKETAEVEANYLQTKKEFDDMELSYKKLQAEYDQEKTAGAQERAILRDKVHTSSDKDRKIMDCCRDLVKRFQEVKATLNEVRTLKTNELNNMNASFAQFQDWLNKTLGVNTKLMTDTMEKYKRELSLRRKYFNIVQELRGNIRVFCRVRPILMWESEKGLKSVFSYSDEEDVLHIPSAEALGGKFTFEYDRVYKPDAKQKDITEDTSEYIQSVMDGYNVSIFAYGQTGSGKTYTMEGPRDDPGVNLHALEKLFKVVEERTPMFDYTIKIALWEIYNDKINCLLTDPKKGISCKARTNNDGTLWVQYAQEVEVQCREDVLKAMDIAKGYRKTGCTKLNDRSSRSHMILSVKVQGFNVLTDIEYIGQLYLVDLAGSERVAKSGATGARLKEAAEINKSLTALGDVMQALQNKAKHVPYRNHTLTYLMQNALGGNAKTVMFINICPTDNHLSETLSSLRFAQRVAKVELGRAQKTYKKVDRLLNRKSSRHTRSRR